MKLVKVNARWLDQREITCFSSDLLFFLNLHAFCDYVLIIIFNCLIQRRRLDAFIIFLIARAHSTGKAVATGSFGFNNFQKRFLHVKSTS